MLCEEISRGFSKHLSVPHLIKGGTAYPQVTRQTGDLDILFPRQTEVSEIHRAPELCSPTLKSSASSWKAIPNSQTLSGSMATPASYHIVGRAGKTRINTHIDITGGSHLFPRIQPVRSSGSVFYKGQVPLVGFYQSMESQAADNLAAVVLRSDTTRWKDFRDLALLQSMSLDAKTIAAELVHKVARKLRSPSRTNSFSTNRKSGTGGASGMLRTSTISRTCCASLVTSTMACAKPSSEHTNSVSVDRGKRRLGMPGRWRR
ncbi:nucleotidyl transferase AbiEii/AbiGii toxin family protein [Sinorhizobium meliloti]|uniref:nucleotidyl transferase AbiEii/AbiGii toxin family protein n=1 Tax=Rhizobium meliloti TaxID=382 RepID=UPI00398D3BBF